MKRMIIANYDINSLANSEDKVDRWTAARRTDDPQILAKLADDEISGVRERAIHRAKELNIDIPHTSFTATPTSRTKKSKQRSRSTSTKDIPHAHFSVYELDYYGEDDNDYEEVDCVKNFNTLRAAIKFAEAQDYPTHICVLTDDLDDEYKSYLEDAGYSQGETVWSSGRK